MIIMIPNPIQKNPSNSVTATELSLLVPSWTSLERRFWPTTLGRHVGIGSVSCSPSLCRDVVLRYFLSQSPLTTPLLREEMVTLRILNVSPGCHLSSLFQFLYASRPARKHPTQRLPRRGLFSRTPLLQRVSDP